MSEAQWWKTPQGIVAAATVVAMVLGFFYVRERRDWDQDSRIESVEKRGTTAITNFDVRFERLEAVQSQLRDQVNFLERKIDHLEFDVKNLKEGKGERYTPHWDKQ